MKISPVILTTKWTQDSHLNNCCRLDAVEILIPTEFHCLFYVSRESAAWLLVIYKLKDRQPGERDLVTHNHKHPHYIVRH